MNGDPRSQAIDERLSHLESAVEQLRVALAELRASSGADSPVSPAVPQSSPVEVGEELRPLPPLGSKVLTEVNCSNCRGGNPPNVSSCMWCHAPMYAAQPRPVMQSKDIVLKVDGSFDSIKGSEYWLNKVGIVLFLLGLAFLFKYSIDQGWLTPWVRVAIGLLFGTILIALGLRLHPTRKHFSQVLLGGGIASYYITGFAAFQLLDLVSYEAAFAFMALVTITAFALSVRLDAVPLALIAVNGGLATPFVLNTGENNIPGLIGYTCIVLLGAAAIYFYKGWRSLLWTAFTGAWSVFFVAFFNGFSTLEDRWALQLGTIFILAFFWLLPVVRDVVRTRDGKRLPNPEYDLLKELLAEEYKGIIDVSVHALVVLTPLLVLVFSAAVWDDMVTKEGWGVISLVGAALFGAVYVWLAKTTPHLAYTHFLVAIAFLTLGLALILDGDTLLVALVVEAALLHLASRRLATSVAGHVLFMTLGLWLMRRLILGRAMADTALLDSWVWDNQRDLSAPITPVLNTLALVDLFAIVVAVAVSIIVRPREMMWLYRIAAHAAFLGWIWREFSSEPNGNAIITLTWGVYALLLLFLGIRLRQQTTTNLAVITLFIVVAKLLLIDLVNLEAVWRILLFLGFGALFLVLSYYFQNLLRARAPVAGDQG